MSTIFISYNRRSKEIAIPLANDIEALGHAVWFDQELSGGQTWWDQILAAIRSCDVFIFVLDPAALNSTACKREFDYAAKVGKPILPVLISDGVSANLLPPALSQIQFVDYRRPDRQAALRLARAFATVPPAKPLPDPLPIPPEVPISYLGTLTELVETSSVLSYQQQSALVVDLRKSLRDVETGDDTRALLERLRKRQDLFAMIADEIDELLEPRKQAPSTRPLAFVQEPPREEPPQEEPPREKPPRDADAPRQESASSPAAATGAITRRERLKGAFVGAAVGAGWGAIADNSFAPNHGGLGLVMGIAGTAGAIVGAIAATRRGRFVAALAGFVLGFVVWAIADNDSTWRTARAGVLGASMGAILGAILGVILGAIRKKRKA